MILQNAQGCQRTLLLEESDAKVILLCNEGEILDENKDIFFKFREKVVGVTLSVVPDIDSVFTNAMEVVKDNELKTFISNKKKQIIDVLDLSKTSNLRHIRRIIYEFIRIYQNISDAAKKNDSYLEELLKYICIFSIEINNNELALDRFNPVANGSWVSFNTHENSALNTISEKYIFSLSNIIITPEFIKNFFMKE